MIFSSAYRASRELDTEIDSEAARLIRERGLPLWTAMLEAQRIVRERRGNEAFDRLNSLIKEEICK